MLHVLTAGGSAYSTQPAPTVRVNKILPSKQYVAFKEIKVDAAKNKIKQLNEEIKVSHVSGTKPSPRSAHRSRILRSRRMTRRTSLRCSTWHRYPLLPSPERIAKRPTLIRALSAPWWNAGQKPNASPVCRIGV